MKPQIRDEITIILSHKSAKLRPFFCCKCGRCVCEVFGDATILVPGMPDPVDIDSLGGRVSVNCTGYVKMRNGTNIKCDAKYIF